ncbi:hypothetical protein NHX12_018003 [Muraenolepis orangiensis]|uniref:Uncharacterized protein n=1 Tax=Muraenolepis orangiensis TaxID=630683 RepID=A0A9Q0EVY8_9TELE|nr:hypothetical protein NHX12_018003 [Muraenolepis orangiensis]
MFGVGLLGSYPVCPSPSEGLVVLGHPVSQPQRGPGGAGPPCLPAPARAWWCWATLSPSPSEGLVVLGHHVSHSQRGPGGAGPPCLPAQARAWWCWATLSPSPSQGILAYLATLSPQEQVDVYQFPRLNLQHSSEF